MATRESIRFDYEKAMRQADELDNIANDLSNLSSKEFGGVLQSVSVNWKSDNSTIYLNKGRTLQEDINKTVKSFKKIADDIRVIARRLYDAEMEAIRIAETRTY